jgi:RNA polymerase sigma factor (sigma-70 family)
MDNIRFDEKLEGIKPNLVAKWVNSSHKKRILANLHERLYPKIRAFIASRVGSSDDAEDLAQDVFVEFHQKDRWYDRTEDIENYVLGVARNLIRQHYRKRAKTIKTIPIEEIGSDFTVHDRRQPPNPSSNLERKEFTESIEEILSELPPQIRQAFKLRFIDGLNTTEAAKQCKCTPNTFRKRLSYAVKTFRIRSNRLESKFTK